MSIDYKNPQLLFLCIAGVVVLLGVIFVAPQLQGLFLLPAGQGDTNATSPEMSEKAVSASLSYAVLENTSLAVTPKDFVVKSCPEESTLDLNVVNNGPRAEEVRLVFPPFLKIFRCTNCSVPSIDRGAVLSIIAVVCKMDASDAAVRIISANAPDVAVAVE